MIIDLDKFITDLFFYRSIIDSFWGIFIYDCLGSCFKYSKLGHNLRLCNDYGIRIENLIYDAWLGTKSFYMMCPQFVILKVGEDVGNGTGGCPSTATRVP